MSCSTVLETDRALELKLSGTYIGQAGLLAQVVDDRPETEIAYWIVRDRWGQNLATEAAIASRDYGFDVLIYSIQREGWAGSRRAAGR